jgi:hypothetical protein
MPYQVRHDECGTFSETNKVLQLSFTRVKTGKSLKGNNMGKVIERQLKLWQADISSLDINIQHLM